MQYELKIEDVSTIRRRLHFTVPSDRVKGELDIAFRDLKKRIRMPGFRPGKVPRNLLEARYGKQIRSQVAGTLIDETYRVAARDLDVAGKPAVEESDDIQGGTAFNFVVAVDVRPEVEVSGYKNLSVDMPVTAVSDDIVDQNIKQQLASQARIEELTEDRAIEQGDFVLTELKLISTDKDTAGEVIADEPGTLINTVGERYYPGVDEKLIGLKKGKTKKGKVTIGDSALEHLKGIDCKMEAKVLGIQTHVVPELDDELAKQMGHDGGADEMRASIRESLEETAQEAGRNQARIKMLEALVEANDFEVPEGMVDEQLNALTEEVKMRRAYGGEDPRSIRFSDDEMADLRQRAVFAAKSSCLLAGVARLEKLEVSDEDLGQKIEEIASMRGQDPAAIRGYLEREGAVSVLTDRIREEKTLGWLLENADLNEVAEGDTKKKAKKKTTKKAAAKKETKAADAAPAAGSDWNKSMKKAELLAVANERGLDVNTKMTKAQIIEALEA